MKQSTSEQSHPLIGHDNAFQQAIEALELGRMHHAWLIAGIEGIGKATLAYQIATHMLAHKASPEVRRRVEKLIAAESHPDMLVIRRATDEKTGELRKGIVVDDALKIGAFFRKTATHGGWRVVIIDEAHALNRNAQNAILKILEEPPAHAIILMTVTTPGALLPTIRSRCRVMHLAPLDDAHMKTILLRQTPDMPPAELQRLITISGGSAGFALKIIRTEVLPLFDELLEILNLGTSLDIVRLHKLADQISRKTDSESFEVITTLLLEKLRMSVRDAALQEKAYLNARLQIWDKIRSTLTVADIANLDRKLAFISAISEARGINMAG